MATTTKSEHTKKSYKFILDWAQHNGVDYYNPKETAALMKVQWPNGGTYKTRLANLIGALKDAAFEDEEVLKEYSFLLSEHLVVLSAEKEAQEPTTKEKENWLDWEEVLKLSKTLKSNFHKSLEALEDAILVGLYTDTEPVRNDYAKIGFTAEYPNWLDLTTGTLTIRQHKTAKTEGCLTRQLPFDLLVMIHLLRAKEVQRPMLFWEDENKLSARLISIFQKHTNKKIGSTMLRHIYITHQRKGDTTLKERAELAKTMGHSQQTQEMYRRPGLE